MVASPSVMRGRRIDRKQLDEFDVFLCQAFQSIEVTLFGDILGLDRENPAITQTMDGSSAIGPRLQIITPDMVLPTDFH
jgi:hypothetical protein